MAGTRPRDPYEVLGVARDAGDAEIKKAFRGLARDFHPDVNSSDPEAEAKFREGAEAYQPRPFVCPELPKTLPFSAI